jgi:iron complex outermembrane recepter protein
MHLTFWARLNVAPVLLALVFIRIPEANAQQASTADSDQLVDIVVTATKRSSTVQSTPISISAITGQDLLDRGLTDFTALAQTVPGVSMRTSGPGQTEFEMRGMSSAGGNSSTVGFYFGDAPLTAPAAAFNGKVVIDPNLYDLDRVEVLRGPQGTLYGSGSMGGTIRVIPSAPDPSAFDASAQTTASHTDGGGLNHAENGMLNLPFASGTAALRLVASESHDSGWIDRIVLADGAFPAETDGNLKRGNVAGAPVAADFRGVNDEKLTSVRASLLWKPTEALDITPSVLYQRIRQDGLSDIDSDPGTNAFYQPFNTPEPFSDRFTLGSLNVQYHFNAFDLTSTTARWVREEDLRQDGTEEIQWALSGPSAPFPFYVSQGGIGPTSPTPLESDPSGQTSEEIRLTSTGPSKFKWLVGYYYGDFGSSTNLTVLVPGAAPVFGTQNAFTQHQTTKILQNAVFGEVSYAFTTQWKLTAGLRRFTYDSSLANAASGVFSSTGSDAVALSATGERDQGVTPKFDLSYEIDKNLLLYATISKGFRPGGANQPIPTAGQLGDVCEADLQANHATTTFVAAPGAFAPDTVWSYEAGEKYKGLDGRLTINGAAYFEKWNGVQQNIPLACGFPYTDNTGDVHIYGTELELNALLVPGLILSANAGYSHARFVVGSLEAGVTSGTRVQNVPDLTSSVALSFHHPLNEQLSFTSRIENTFVGSRTDVTYAVNNLPSYDLTDVRLGLDGSHWSAIAFAKNVFNKRALLGDATQISINLPLYNRIAVNQPLTVGVDLSYHFGHQP